MSGRTGVTSSKPSEITKTRSSATLLKLDSGKEMSDIERSKAKERDEDVFGRDWD